MRTTLALVDMEFRLLIRDTTAWGTAIALPLFLGGIWVVNERPFGDGWSAIVVLQVLMLLLFTLHTVGTMVLASRREQLVLKRWRGSEASDASIVVGSIGVPVLLVLAQTLVLTGITVAVSGRGPDNVPVVVAAVLIATITVAALTLVVAAFTRSAEHAMITTFPVFIALGVGGYLGLARPVGDLAWGLMAIPGAAAVQLIRLGWDGTQVLAEGATLLSAAGPLLAMSAVVTVAAAVLALRTFRWEPRT